MARSFFFRFRAQSYRARKEALELRLAELEQKISTRRNSTQGGEQRISERRAQLEKSLADALDRAEVLREALEELAGEEQ